MINIPRATPEQREQCEKLYKLYQINNKADYEAAYANKIYKQYFEELGIN